MMHYVSFPSRTFLAAFDRAYQVVKADLQGSLSMDIILSTDQGYVGLALRKGNLAAVTFFNDFSTDLQWHRQFRFDSESATLLVEQAAESDWLDLELELDCIGNSTFFIAGKELKSKDILIEMYDGIPVVFNEADHPLESWIKAADVWILRSRELAILPVETIQQMLPQVRKNVDYISTELESEPFIRCSLIHNKSKLRIAALDRVELIHSPFYGEHDYRIFQDIPLQTFTNCQVDYAANEFINLMESLTDSTQPVKLLGSEYCGHLFMAKTINGEVVYVCATAFDYFEHHLQANDVYISKLED